MKDKQLEVLLRAAGESADAPVVDVPELTRRVRSEFAVRLWVGMADGNQPWIYSFGGMDTMR